VFAIWGLSPLYFALINHVPAFEVMVHRVIWAVPMVGLYAAMTGQWGAVRAVGRSRRGMAVMAMAAAMVSINWFVFVYAIQTGRTAEASFGYYIYPLLAVVLGALVFRERITGLQRGAAALAAVGVLGIAIARGTPPWIALIVACSFAIYGAIRKSSSVGPLVGVFWELILMTPPMLLYLAWISGGVFGADMGTSLLLVGCSFFTAVPLIIYVEVTKILEFSTVGVLFYLNPTLQFISALLLGEALSMGEVGAFGIIWIGVAIYCYDLLRRRRS